MNYISSVDNKIFKEVCGLKNRRDRHLKKCHLIEGIRFVQEALSCDGILNYVVVEESKKDFLFDKLNLNDLGIKVYIFSDVLFSKIKQTENTQGIIANVNMNLECKNFKFNDGIYFLIDRIQDPGNLGTIIRTAVAVNALGVIVVKGTVDVYNDKVLRSTMGSIFKIDIYFIENYFVLNEFLNNGFKFVIADSCGEKIYYNESLVGKIILAVGNEGNGLSDEIKNFPHLSVVIPMCNNLESLNVAQALSVIAFEYVRQNDV